MKINRDFVKTKIEKKLVTGSFFKKMFEEIAFTSVFLVCYILRRVLDFSFW